MLRSALLAAATLWRSGLGAPFGERQPARCCGPGGHLALAATVAVAPFLGRPASYRRVLALVLFGQFGLHLVLSVAAGHGPRPATDYGQPLLRRAQHAGGAGPGCLAAVGHADELTSGLGGLLAELTSVDGLTMMAAHVGRLGRVGALAGDR